MALCWKTTSRSCCHRRAAARASRRTRITSTRWRAALAPVSSRRPRARQSPRAIARRRRVRASVRVRFRRLQKTWRTRTTTRSAAACAARRRLGLSLIEIVSELKLIAAATAAAARVSLVRCTFAYVSDDHRNICSESKLHCLLLCRDFSYINRIR